MSTLKIVSLKGDYVHPYIEDLAHLRITVFREYPYRYEGNMNYERNYLSTYVECEDAMLVLIFDKDQIVGASTAVPLIHETAECKKPFLDHNMDLSKIFYLGESVLLKEYRGQGIYKHFFQHREAMAKECGCLYTTFCAVSRPNDDPHRPEDYVSLEEVWHKFGYDKHPSLCAYYAWKEIGMLEKTEKPMPFWMKSLS